ncbi:MAG TPA: hypothetical protein VJM31_04670 [Vicinamibacterales bacterium]|nr:hypothetical protein [Vicinamibacterales bacterium]
MNPLSCRAAILVTAAALAFASAAPIAQRDTVQRAPEKVEALWVMPDDIAARDLLNGPGGAELAVKPESSFTWVATDTTGYSPGFDVRDAAGRSWSVKLGPEAQSEIVASRVLWAIGYHQLPTYYLANWQLSGGPGGRQPAGRFRANFEDAKVVGDWAWASNPFSETQALRGLIVANVLLNSWDWKTSNNKIYRDANGKERYLVRDLGASLGKTSASRLLWVLPIAMRGFGQGSRNDIAGFESQGFIKRIDGERVVFDFDTIYDDVVDRVRPSDVRWTAELLGRITDAQWDDALKAADYSPDIRARYIKKIKAKIAEGLAVS